MSAAMLHGLGDCTLSLNCGCMDDLSRQPLPRGGEVKYYNRKGQEITADKVDWSGENRRVARTEITDKVLVSTAFLVINHNFGDGPPVLFETMVFGGPLDQECERYNTEEEALAGHQRIVSRVRATEKAKSDA